MSRDAEKMREALREYFSGKGPLPADSADLLEAGFVDSMGMMDLIAFVESEFGVRFDPQNMKFENFRSVERILATIADAKKGS